MYSSVMSGCERTITLIDRVCVPAFVFGEWVEPDSHGDVLYFPVFALSSDAMDLIEVLYDGGYILTDFDWGAWQDEARRYVKDPLSVHDADLPTIKKLLTTHVRTERFCEGHLNAMCESGHLLVVLKRLKELIVMPRKESYVQRAKKHLSAYKRERIGLNLDGKWRTNKKPYTHLLPVASQSLNILETYRREFWQDFYDERWGRIALHPAFHHLTSSQAMCFNLFYPFLANECRHLALLLDALGLGDREVKEATFEKILRPEEGTALDFYIEFMDGTYSTFELKFTESGFGKVTLSDKYRKRWEDVYSKMVGPVLNPETCTPEVFFSQYQFLRNLCYLSNKVESLCFFIAPEGNVHFSDTEEALDAALLPEYRHRAKVLSVKELLGKLTTAAAESEDGKLKHHLDAFAEKYLVP